MDGVTISFNMNVQELQELGVDVTTSEGKAEMKQLILEAVRHGIVVETGGPSAEEIQKLNTLFEEDDRL